MKLVIFEEYNKDFDWDFDLHFPVPTIEYLQRRSGLDLLEMFDTEVEAKGKLLSVVRTAKNYLFANRRDMLAWEWEMAHKVEVIYEVLEYVLEFINFAFLSGDYKNMFDLVSGIKESAAIENAKMSLLRGHKVLAFRNDIRVGY